MKAEKEYIVIKGCGAISPLGSNPGDIAQAYTSGIPAFKTTFHQEQPTPVAVLPEKAEHQLQDLLKQNPNYKHLDKSVLMAVFAARQAAEQAGWLQEGFTDHDLGVNIGSSRGATGLFEQHLDTFQQRQLTASASPTTTLGNLSSWVAHAVNAGGAQISHSITCSTALMAVANAAAWLKAGMAKRFLAGGTEAPLTDFTIAQMKAIGIYSKLHNHTYPCQPYAMVKQNTFVLGEGAAVLALELEPASIITPGTIVIEAIGLGFESIKSKTGISADGLNFQQSMQHALHQLPDNERTVDLIITHTPGTAAGDTAELNAISSVFKEGLPAITTNKFLLGHTLGASGALSLQYALYILQSQTFPTLHYTNNLPFSASHKKYKRIMVNAAGFGGNAASIILKQL
ncbi:beta-ketoacyl-ACP reductase [Pontibacter sp. KCTC 32443]|uniref:beta-ketoacyl synthase N-terminal-like domain-containing protein n=1 Tax=Pontibacter TaxID=323449 RepID=UPI00164E9296|nr:MULTISPECIES: beta-ketoacyl synthase N-terminal-like domain-containing protein [Pontibacter]MBC5775060.1 beta-ketoacyl-ACP reductase [Pontibacter sp. KCTC 32443]